MPQVYVETSIVSYLRARRSRDVVAAARQVLTRRWWDEQRHQYELVTSQYVLDEAAVGDSILATERLNALAGIPLLAITDEVQHAAAEILQRGILPADAQYDALHIAVASAHAVEYLLTWNCRHIANAHVLPRIRDLLTELGYFIPIICTPEEMVGEE